MKNKFTKKQLKIFKTTFEKRRVELIKKLNVGEDNIRVDYEGDEVDVVQGVALNSVRETLSQRDLQTLQKLNQALTKIDDGSFGLCDECGEKISEKRLLAVLGCSSCIDCAENSEEMAKRFVQ